jgi:hypothetical protein
VAEVIAWKAGFEVVKTRLRASVILFGLLLVVGSGVSYGAKVLDRILAVLVLGVYIAGSAALVLKTLVSRPGDRKHIFSCGELALLPESWRRWLLDEQRE